MPVDGTGPTSRGGAYLGGVGTAFWARRGRRSGERRSANPAAAAHHVCSAGRRHAAGGASRGGALASAMAG